MQPACRLAGLSLAIALIAATAPLSAQTPPLASVAFSNEIEAALVRTLEALRKDGIQSALQELDATLAKKPNFRLGHLIRGDLLMAKSGIPVALSAAPGVRTEPDLLANLSDLRHEAHARLNRYFDAPPPDALPSALMMLAPPQQHALVVDVARSRLYVFRNEGGKPVRVDDVYMSIGKRGSVKEREGDKKTPVGIYHVTNNVAKERLSPFYGPGAFAINFPNDIDRKFGRTGSGIWIHGTPPDTYSRPPWASDGCVVLTNDDFERIGRYVDPGSTPVVIAPSVEWYTEDDWERMRGAFSTQFAQWQRDWESLDTDAYLAHYSPRFHAEGKNLDAWSSHKRRVNQTKSFVKIDIANLSVFEYPASAAQPGMLMVTFDQDYKSSNSSTRMKKRQYWQRENGRWRIVFEGAAG